MKSQIINKLDQLPNTKKKIKKLLSHIKNISIKIKKKTYPKFKTKELIETLKPLGLKKDATVFIHSSWDQFFNFEDSPIQLIEALLNEIGQNGTLAMPAFPKNQNPDQLFNVKRTPSGAGFLTEIFRRFPNVKRSINLIHSVTALGPNADYLTKDHHKSKTPWDHKSPYYRLKEVDALILGLGVGKNLSVATSLHCIDSLLKDSYPFFAQLFEQEITYQYKDYNGTVNSHRMNIRISSTLNTKQISKYMAKDKFIETKLSNLEIYRIPAKYLIEKGLELANKGITMYVTPKPVKKLFIPFKN